MDLIGTIRHEYFYQQEQFGDDTLYCVYRKIIVPDKHGEFSYTEFMETYHFEEDAQIFVIRLNKNGK
jgi:hypothetical protein